MEIITSKQNPAVIAAAKLADKKYREMTRTFAFEGVKLFCEAVSAGVRLTRVFATEAAYEKYGALLSGAGEDKLTLVSEPVYEKLSFERSPQGIFCVAEYFEPQTSQGDASFVIFLDGVSDPGNFGAVLRAADAFGADTVYAGENGADLYNPKTVRERQTSQAILLACVRTVSVFLRRRWTSIPRISGGRICPAKSDLSSATKGMGYPTQCAPPVREA